ncbi:hypothetical protein HDU79_003484 [Rhizoclosmatium sp. JEL0117]|nr:hypothetical protein HDU79_003484 [Rhizoclosmatium sp. JEL0117]
MTDDYCMGALFHAHTFLHKNLTRLKPTDNTEYTVMMTEGTPVTCTDALLALGARILIVPMIEPPDGEPMRRYALCFSKLQMFALDTVYDKIFYTDGDLLYFTKSPVPEVFQYIDDWHEEREQEGKTDHVTFYGGAKDLLIDTVNAGMLLFEPSLLDYQKLLELIPMTMGFGDQGTLQEYYRKDGPHPAVYIPSKYNTQWVMRRTEMKLQEAVGFHHKFLLDDMGSTNFSKNIFPWYSQGYLDLRRIQMEHLAKDVGRILPVVPIVQDSLDKVLKFRNLTTMYDRIALLSMGNGSTIAQKSRVEFSNHLWQANLISPETDFGNLFRLISFDLLEKYEWIWVVDSNLIMNVTADPFYYALERLTNATTPLVLFKDCFGSLTGSFIIGKAGLPILKSVYEKNHLGHEIWTNFLKRAFSWDVVNVVNGNHGLYSFERDSCSYFLKTVPKLKHVKDEKKSMPRRKLDSSFSFT